MLMHLDHLHWQSGDKSGKGSGTDLTLGICLRQSLRCCSGAIGVLRKAREVLSSSTHAVLKFGFCMKYIMKQPKDCEISAMRIQE